MRKASARQVRPAEDVKGEEDRQQGGGTVSSMPLSTKLPRNRRWGSLLRALVIVGGLLIGLACGTPAFAAETRSHWSLESRTAPENLPPGKEGMIIATASNLGDADVRGENSTVTITDTLPKGIEATTVEDSINSIQNTEVRAERLAEFACPKKTGVQIECTYKGELPPYELLQLKIRVHVGASAPSESANLLTVSGGEAQPETATLDRKVHVSNVPASFGVESYELTPETEDFERDTQAGSHPFQLTTTFNVNQGFEPDELLSGVSFPSAPALEKNLSFRLPAGLIGNVNAVRQCTDVDFGSQNQDFANGCPNDTVVGVASVTAYDPNAHAEYYATYVVPVFNLEPAAGEPARFGFSILHVPVTLNTAVRTGEDYGVTVSVNYASENVQVLGSKVTFWGIPSDERHNTSRGWMCLLHGKAGEVDPCETNATPTQPVEPLLMLPTKCIPAGSATEGEEVISPVSGEAWNGLALTGASEANGEIPNESPTVLSHCGGLAFDPAITVEPETQDASTPTGINVTVSVPQAGTMEPSYENKAEAAVSGTTLELPVGLETSAAAANGLSTCGIREAGFHGEVSRVTGFPEHSEGELETESGGALEEDLSTQESFTSGPATCPESAKIGTVSIKTPVLERELTGGVYLAEQDTNPFASPLVLYLIAEDKAPGEVGTAKVLVKLAGEVTINPENGQLISHFKETPQSPFETLKLHLWNGPRASQATPAQCGSYPSVATFTNSSNAQPLERTSDFQITSGPGGSPCPGATLPFQPSFEAESASTNAAAFTPFTVRIRRPDGDAALRTISVQLPPGLAAVLGPVPLCEEPQAKEGTCSPASEIGTSVASSGLGTAPYRLPGTVYLTGPYNGAPYGLASVTEAKAGPFDLGRTVVRSSIFVNENTAAATIDTEASQFLPLSPSAGEQTTFAGLPERLKGVPAQIKELEVTVNRENFEFNPTNCEAMTNSAKLTGYEGTSAELPWRFQVGNCAGLPFAPKLTASVVGHGSKADGTTFTVTVEAKGLGQANIHKVDLTIPAKLPSRLSTIQKACVEAVFNADPANCDEGSDIGEGIVNSPVFNSPLKGPAYLVSHGGAAFPDVEFVLKGTGNASERAVTIVLDGKTNIKNGITYSRFETSPDAPFTKFESIFPAGPHSALTPSVPESEDFSLCKQTLTIPTEITGQNGAFMSQSTPVSITGCSGVKGVKVTKLTRTQQLAKVLKLCRTKYKAKSKKSKRLVCEKQARKKYGPKAKTSPKKSAGKSSRK
jgi:hypothetical protein